MKQHHLRLFLLSLTIGGGGSAFAQSDLPYIFTARPKYTFSAALKIRTSGASVRFGNLGSVPYYVAQVDPATNKLNGNNLYHDGQVSQDGLRLNEVASAPSPGTVSNTSFPVPYNNGTRYRTYITTVDSTDPNNIITTTSQTGDFLSYQAGQTRGWSYVDPSQASNGFIDMHAYSARSDGASAEAKSGSSGGFDLQLAREFGMVGKRGQWGFALSLGVNDINAKTSGAVSSTLVTETGHYSLLGQSAPPAFDAAGNPLLPYNAPTYVDLPLVDANGVPIPDPNDATKQLIQPNGLETTTPLASAPTSTTTTTKAGGVQVNGRWQVKGAYYIARLGPSFRYQFTKRISLFGNAGVAAGYIGSVYSVTESFALPTGTLAPAPSVTEELRKTSFSVGYYGELNMEFWLSFRTGLFAGVVYEHLGTFSQTLGGRSANVNIGGGSAFRIGIINRF